MHVRTWLEMTPIRHTRQATHTPYTMESLDVPPSLEKGMRNEQFDGNELKLIWCEVRFNKRQVVQWNTNNLKYNIKKGSDK